MRTYKFLTMGAKGPITGFTWPVPAGGEPGAWIEVTGALSACARGAHLCRRGDLAYWLHDELWEAETSGARVDGLDCVVVQRARLVRRFDAWGGGGAKRFAEASAEHASELTNRAPPAAGIRVQGYIDDARHCAESGLASCGAFAAAMAVSKLGRPEEAIAAYRNERAWQADWIARQILGDLSA